MFLTLHIPSVQREPFLFNMGLVKHVSATNPGNPSLGSTLHYEKYVEIGQSVFHVAETVDEIRALLAEKGWA